MSNTVRRTAVAVMFLTCARPASALNASLGINQYAHTAWKAREGFAPGRIVAIAQSQDGYLWLGTESGLFRFDGVKLTRWQPPMDASLPSTHIRSLVFARDGRLWIGTTEGLVSWKDEKLIEYPALTGLMTNSILEDRDGTVWFTGGVVGVAKVCGIRRLHVECSGEDGRLGRWATSLYERDGHVWVASDAGLWRWAPGEPTLYRTTEPLRGSLQSLTNDDTVGLLVVTGTSVKRFINETFSAVPFAERLVDMKPEVLLRDRDGGLWIGTVHGLVHVHGGRTDVFASSDGLSDNAVVRLFEDREGNIWVATNSGLDRFRENAAVTFSSGQGLPDGIAASVLATNDGSLWVNVADKNLARWTVAGNTLRVSANGIGSLMEDARGRVWVSTLEGVGQLDSHRLTLSGVPGGVVDAMVEDLRGTLWVANELLGLFRLSASHAVQRIPSSIVGRPDPVVRLAADPTQDGIWLGFIRGGIALLSDGRVRASYGTAEGLGRGRVNDLHVDRDGTLWAATDGGLSRLKHGRITTLTSSNGLPCDAVDSTLQDDDGSTWLYLGCGLVRIERIDMAEWIAAVDKGTQPKRSVRVTTFDSSDGVQMFASLSTYSPHATKTRDGRLWFASVDGAMVVDPRHLPFNGVPPPVRIEQIRANRTTYDADAIAGGLRLPPLTSDLQIDYTALSLVAAEKVRFRYKLEGRDREWQEAGTRRQAYYTNLPPRTYRFHVVASNNSGVWTDTGAALEFSIAPTYYQTTWFWSLIVGMAIALSWSAHRARLRFVETHEREITALNERTMKAQEQERMRIAGELHDGVVQQMLSVTMMLGSAKRRVATNPSEATAAIEKVQEKLIQAGADIRQLSHGLHPPILQEAGLAEAVRSYCEEFSTSREIAVTCEADESVRDLSRGAALALFRVMQEALGNAAKHAEAKHITVGLTRTDGNVALSVSDDGQGFDPGRLDAGGGLGLVMMRERATQLNGTFHFESEPGRGTTITVVIPFR